MKSVQVILNPYAGRGRGARTKDALAVALRAAQVDFDMTLTERPGHAIELAAAMRSSGCRVIVAAGGDGTVNEVLNGLAQATPAGEVIGQLAACPIGGGNDFADMSGLERGVEALAQRIAAGKTRLIDVGRGKFASESQQIVRYFDNNVGLGFEAQVTVESNGIKRMSGPLRYLVGVFKALNRYTSPHMQVRWKKADEQWIERAHPAFMVAMGNSRRTGGLFYVNPDAVLDDGLLDLAVVPHKSVPEILWMLPQTFTGAHRNDPKIHFDRCVEVKVNSARPVPVHLDGEVVMKDLVEAHVELLPSQLEIVV